MTNFEENNINNEEKPTFEFSDEISDNSLVNEFNAFDNDDNSFDFSEMNIDESIMDDYEKNVLSNGIDDGEEKGVSVNDDKIELNYNGIKSEEHATIDNSVADDYSFNQDIFNDIKNDTFNYEDTDKYENKIDVDNNIQGESKDFNDNSSEEIGVRADDNYNQNESLDDKFSFNDDLINESDAAFSEDDKSVDESNVPFDASIFDNIDDSNILGLNIENSNEIINDNNANEELNNVSSEDKSYKNIMVEDNTINNESFEQEQVSNDDKDINKEKIYSSIDDSIKELDASTDFKVDDEPTVTDINNLFVKVNSNVQEASDIFSRNVEMKKILDNRFEELKKLQADIEMSRKNNYDEITAYKEEVINKLSDKKQEIEDKLDLLKNLQAQYEKEKNEFEEYKKNEIIKIEKMRKEEETYFEARREELNRIEDKLRKQKDFLEEEKRQLSLDQIKYETDKNELANNMIKFNEIVGKFTSGIDGIN